MSVNFFDNQIEKDVLRVQVSDGIQSEEKTNIVVVNQNSGASTFKTAVRTLDDSQFFKTPQLQMDEIYKILSLPTTKSLIRLSVLNADESVKYVIPLEDVIADSVQYTENYTNGQRRSLSFKLINIKYRRILRGKTVIKEDYPYMPNVNKLWYGKKVKLEYGFQYLNYQYFFEKGVFIIDNFDVSIGRNSDEILYSLSDKFGLFSKSTGTLLEGYEIPVGSSVKDVIQDLLNMSGSDGYVLDPKDCLMEKKYTGFKTQSTIRVDQGGTMADIIDQVATQMSAEYYYNEIGNLVFNSINDSMNTVEKPVVWQYNNAELSQLQFKPQDNIVNVVKVVGNNVGGSVYSAVEKNENLNSPINVFYIKERNKAPITNANIWSDWMAKELAQFYLRKESLLVLKQSLSVPYNPILKVNYDIEITNEELGMYREKYIIQSISYTSNSNVMQLEVVNENNLPFIGGVGL